MKGFQSARLLLTIAHPSIMPQRVDFVSKLTQTIGRFDFSHFGCVPLERPISIELYRDWLKAGHQAGMDYLERHLPMKEEPKRFAPQAQSVIVIAKTYFPHPYPALAEFTPRTALYAAGMDYHDGFRRELEDLASALKADFPSEEFLCFTDSAPVLERDLAVQAGLGWVGKNTCVIHPKKGSLFFLGEIFTSVNVQARPERVRDFCGTCDRCLKACPTQALIEPKVLDANKCISYWTIEAKTSAPEHLRRSFGDWFFGCDICQTVCPWNEKVFDREKMRRLTVESAPSERLLEDLRMLLTSSNRRLNEVFAGRPYSRARAKGLRRNALYVIGNLRLRELRPEVEVLRSEADYQDLADWTLRQFEC